MSADEKNPYDVLQVSRYTDDPIELKKAYRKQMSKYHTDKPDNLNALQKKYPDKSPEEIKNLATSFAKEVNRAWNILKDPKTKSTLDAMAREHQDNSKASSSKKENTRNSKKEYTKNSKTSDKFDDHTFALTVNEAMLECHGPSMDMDVETDASFIDMFRKGFSTLDANHTTIRVGNDIIEIKNADIGSGFIVCVFNDAIGIFTGEVKVNGYKCTPRDDGYVNLYDVCPSMRVYSHQAGYEPSS